MSSMTCPSNDTVPPLGRSCPHMQLNNVVLPAPFGPTRPTASPAASDSDTSLRAATPPKRMETDRASSRGGGASATSIPNAGAGAGPPALTSTTERLPQGHAHGGELFPDPSRGARRLEEARSCLARPSLVIGVEQLALPHNPPALLVLHDAFG